MTNEESRYFKMSLEELDIPSHERYLYIFYSVTSF